MTKRLSTWSLRGRLVWISACALALTLLFGGVAMYWAASVSEGQMLDSRLEHLGAVILSFVEEELEEELREVNVGLHTLPLNMKSRPSATLLYRYQVWTRHGSLVMRSHEASSVVPLIPLNRLGFDVATIDGELHRTFALPTRNAELIVQVAENNAESWAQTSQITLYYVAFLIVPFGLVLVGMWWMFRHTLRSVDSMADQLRDRTSHDLTPVQVDKPPLELLPVLKAVDTFFERMRNALSVERNFTAVAAHEMRTPLAGLRAHAQLAKSANNSQEHTEALNNVMTGVDRASYLLEQLLDLARIESLDQESVADSPLTEIRLTFQSVMADLGPFISARQLNIQSDFQVTHLRCVDFALHLLLANLIGNAARHTPMGGRIDILTRRVGRQAQLIIDDSGPGVAEELRRRAFERFERLGDRQAGGVGLGLSIVRSVALAHRASIELLDSPLGGLRAVVRFPEDLEPKV